MEILSVKNLTFSYEGAKSAALQQVSLKAERGEMILLCGPCGCGKTTLLKLIKKRYKNAGYLFQNPESQIVCEYVRDELVFGMENTGMPVEHMARQLAELTAYLGMEELLEKKTSQLSGGQKQMVNLASILLMNPKILLLDEPLSQLDPVSRWEFVKLLDKLKEELGMTILVAEHNLEYFLHQADRVVFLEQGRIGYEGERNGFVRKLYQENHPFFHSLPEVVKLCFSDVRTEVEQIPFTVQEYVRSFGGLPEGKKQEENAGEELQDMQIKISSGYFRYEKKEKDVLKNVSLEIKYGKIYALIGGNGAGKSTLFSVLAGAKKFYRGKCERKGSIGILPQNPVYAFLKPVFLEDLKMLASIEQIEKLAEKYSFFDGIQEFYEGNPLDLSGGEMQKAALFKILLVNPDILLLDEPAKAMDGYEKKLFGEMLLELKKEGITIFMISHDLEFVQEYAQECFMMFQGEIIAAEKPEKMFKDNRFYTTVKGRIRGMENDTIFAGN